MPHPGFGRPDDAAGLLGPYVWPSSLATLVSRDCRLTPTRSGIIESSGPPRLVAAADDLSGNPDDHGARRDFFDHNGIGADPAVVADFDRAEHLGAGADDHPVADGRVAFAGVPAGAARA